MDKICLKIHLKTLIKAINGNDQRKSDHTEEAKPMVQLKIQNK